VLCFRLRRAFTLLLAMLGLCFGGCGEPPEFVASAAPGEDFRSRIAASGPEPEARGETSGGAVPTVPQTESVVVKPSALPTAPGEIKETASGVKYETLKAGAGAVARSGQKITIRYVGKLEDGRTFDQSPKDNPAMFPLGANLVLGWQEGVPGMHIGETRKLTVPPNAGYGAQGKGPVPQNATMIFEIELIDLE